MLRSQTATRFDFTEQFEPGPVIIDNLRILCEQVLQPLRDSMGRAVFVNSGYRCHRLNQAVGGSQNSQHLIGQAADIETSHLTIEQLYQRIKNSSLPFDQLIQEFGYWVHISFNPAGGRKQCFRAIRENGRVKYLLD